LPSISKTWMVVGVEPTSSKVVVLAAGADALLRVGRGAPGVVGALSTWPRKMGTKLGYIARRLVNHSSSAGSDMSGTEDVRMVCWLSTLKKSRKRLAESGLSHHGRRTRK